MVAHGYAGRVGQAMWVQGCAGTTAVVVTCRRRYLLVCARGRVCSAFGRVWARVGHVRGRVCGMCCHDVVSLCGQAYTPPH
jgi:hypothetical protein